LLKKIDFLVVQESVPSQAMDFARVVLPACAFGEQSGTVFNMERRLLRLKQAFSSPGQALPDWEILRRLMAAQGFEVPPDLEGIQREIAKAAPDLGGLFVVD
ncbi:MAG: molybdopterin-dependent oxidoreductase, partial [Syntrophobacteraceae bacterium]|nr:molybdopterin-dependent oxidoreductase [Syntrophobacteraceae bacterium]